MRKISLCWMVFVLACSLLLPAHIPVVDAAPLSWEFLSSLSTARTNHTLTLLSDGRLLAVGGKQDNDSYLNSAAIYDPFRGSWSAAASMQYARSGHTAVLLPDGRVLVAGGKGLSGIGTADYLNNAEIYDPTTNTWTLLSASMSSPRQFHTATLLTDGRVLLVGGQTGLLTLSNTGELFDPRDETFTPLKTSLTNGLKDHTATRLPDGTVLIAGGQTSLNTPLSYTNTTAIFDPADNSLRAGVSFSGSRGAHSATLLNNGMVLIAGGRYYSSLPSPTTNYHNSVQLYDPITQSWEDGTALTNKRAYHHAALIPNGDLLVCGGYNGTILSSCEQYETDTNTWRASPSFKQARYYHTTVLLPSGSLMAVGGSDGSEALRSVELLDPAPGYEQITPSMINAITPETVTRLPNHNLLITGIRVSDQNTKFTEMYNIDSSTWSMHVPMNHIRRYHTATLLPNGQVLVTGGLGEYNQTTVLNTTEIYDPQEKTWTNAAPMTNARAFHSATLLANGKVLIVGGDNKLLSERTLASVEIYDPSTDTWSETTNLNFPRMDHRALLLKDGRVMIAGGLAQKPGSTTLSTLKTVELFNPSDQTWFKAESMSNEVNSTYGKSDFTMTLLPDGRVLVTGGRSGLVLYAQIERYNPETNTWSDLGLLPSERAGHSATLMGDGRVLLAGGSNDSTILDQYLVFDPAAASITRTSTMTHARTDHKSVLLPNGRVMILGGNSTSSEYLKSTEQYIGWSIFSQSWQPQINAVSNAVIGEALTITGNQFYGHQLLEASSGGTQSVSSGYPLLLLYSLGNEQVQWLTPDPAAGFSPTSFTSVALTEFPVGPAYAIIYSNGIPSDPFYVSVQSNITFSAPQITSTNSTVFKVDEFGSFVITTRGNPTPSITQSGVLPDGISFTDRGDGTAILTGIANHTLRGVYPLILTAQNGVDPADVQYFSLIVEGERHNIYLPAVIR